MRSRSTALPALLLAASSAHALRLPTRAPSAPSRRDVLSTGASLLAAAGLGGAPAFAETTASGVQYSVLKKGTGGTPTTGDLIAIRFKGAVKETGVVFDDILSSAEPYYTRVGSGNVLQGVEEVVKLMRSGDTWQLTIPGKLAFGDKGRSASPGKPRIPSNAVIDFTLELVAVPGKDEEILDLDFSPPPAPAPAAE